MASCDYLRVRGMTCTSCEVIIERKLKTIPGIERVQVNHRTGRCAVYSDPKKTIQLSTIQEAVASHGYTIEPWRNESSQAQAPSAQRSQLSLGVTLILIVTIYIIVKALGVVNLTPALDQSVSIGTAIVLGLIASTSTCLAVVGGLVMGLSAKLAAQQTTPNRWQRLKPHLWFQSGRLVSYFIFGGLIGLIGQAFTLSPRASGVVSVVVAVMMIILGLDLVGIVNVKRFLPRLPKWFAHTIHDVAETPKPWTPLALGALTFFLPCGFTQAMQLYVLTTGSFWEGALTMFMFALGTLPALLGIGMASSFARGRVMQTVIKVSGAVVLVLGFYNFSSGWRLLGLPALSAFTGSTAVAADPTPIVDGKQVVSMAVDGINYQPNQITVKAGVPVEWHIDGARVAGCTSVITIPKLGITEVLSQQEETVIAFTPTTPGTLPFTCSMGMAYGKFIVTS